MKKTLSTYLTAGVMTLAMLQLCSCVTHEELLNFNTGQPFPDSLSTIRNLPDLKIQPDDLLSIKVKALDMEAAVPYNLDLETAQNAGANSLQNTRALLGYLVDKEGNIDFPQIGTIKAAGKTTLELKNELENALKPYLNDPVIQVRFFNFRITLMGEVNRPGTFVIPTERVSILDALGQAGDLTVYADRTNILLIREQQGKREFIRLNLQDRNIFNSPYFYLVQNDLIYIEPVDVKTASIRDQSQRITPWISVIGTVVSLIISIISLTK
jgi:polysaccharide export outer membrane protein